MSLMALTNSEFVRAALDPLTRRDLIARPPRDAENMQQIGISATNLDGPVRSWINGRFRRPNNLWLLTRGAIKADTTWSNLLKLLTEETPA